jgi:hypothetical protein
MKTILSALIFMVAVLGGATMALTLFAQTEPRNSHAAKLRRLAQEANQLANESETPPLPAAPANAIALSNMPMAMPSPMAVKSFRTAHPSGAMIDVTLPTNMVAIQIPRGYYLTNRIVRDITLDEFNGFKETNGEAMIWYFQRR